MERLVAVVAVKRVKEMLPLFLGIRVSTEVGKVRIPLRALRKSPFFTQIALQEPLICFWEGEE